MNSEPDNTVDEDALKRRFRRRFKCVILLRGYTHKYVADRLGITKQAVALWTRKGGRPDRLRIAGVEAILGLPAGFFDADFVAIRFFDDTAEIDLASYPASGFKADPASLRAIHPGEESPET